MKAIGPKMICLFDKPEVDTMTVTKMLTIGGLLMDCRYPSRGPFLTLMAGTGERKINSARSWSTCHCTLYHTKY